MTYTYDYPRPMVTVDLILIYESENPEIVLIQRKNEPHKGKWALPGGFVEMDEDLNMAAIREMEEETGIKVRSVNQFKTYGTLNRDPRGRSITVVYFALTKTKKTCIASSDATNAEWFNIKALPPLAFDHETVIADFIKENFHHHQ